VVTATGGFQEIVRHGHNGLLALPGNAESLAHNVVALLSALGLADKLRRNALRHVQEHCAWEHIAARTAAVYEEVLAEWAETRWDAALARRRAEAEQLWPSVDALVTVPPSRYTETRAPVPAVAQANRNGPRP